ncbi:MAG: Delta-60 repeat-containing protein [Phycisphaerales bacterium]|nr:Delta-60 repeat-containing protein [Phycisphaerales bacterium]
MAAYPGGGTVLGGGGLVSRVNGAGKLVNSFGTSGTKSVALSVAAVAVQKDGKILLWGASVMDPSQMEVMRLRSNGKPDLSFGSAGVAKVSFSDLGAGTVANSITVLPNGKIVVSGTQADQPPPNASQATTERAVVARLMPNGRLDGSFASGGIDLLPVTPPDNIPMLGTVSANVAVQPDGSFLAVYDGNANTSVPVPVRVYHFTSTGALDTAFGTMGFTDLPNAPIGGGYRAFVRPDHKIELVGGDGTTTSLSLLNPNGSIDTQFGTAGTVTGLAGNPITAFETKAGKIVVATDNTWDGSAGDDVALVRYGLDGKLDDSFGYHGVTIDPLGISGPTNAVALQKDKKIIDAGSEQAPVAGQPTDAAMVRYNPDGTLDTSFGSRGRVMVQMGLNSSFTSVAVAPDGSIYAGATGDNGSATSPTPVYALYRFKKSGALDKHFGIKGRAITDGPIIDLKVLASGDVLALTRGAGAVDGFLTRYLPTGRLDASFGVAGRADLGPSDMVNQLFLLGSSDMVHQQLLVEPDGGILVGSAVGIIKYTAAGQRDMSFGIGGAAFDLGLDSMALAPDGDIVAANTFVISAGIVTGGLDVTRFLPDGTLDPSFAAGGLLPINPLLSPNDPANVRLLQGIVVQPGGDIVVGAVQNGGPLIGLVRIDSSGNVDVNFGGASANGGFVQLMLGGFDGNSVPALVQQPDGNILAATNFSGNTNALDTPSRLFRVLGS